MTKSALVTGVTGQDGSYLAELLLGKGYEVHGLVRRLGTAHLGRLKGIKQDLSLLEGDLMDQASLDQAVAASEPDEIYNLAGPAFVASSFKQPILTGEIGGLGAVRVMEAAKKHAPDAKIYQASSSEMFGGAKESPQNENTPFHPRTPYGIAKVYAFMTGRYYRENYGTFVCNGIMYNHESPRRGLEYVTRKITHSVARIAHGLQDSIDLGNLDSRRDWGYAPEYVEAMWLMLQQDTPDDFVVATGETHSVREFVEAACAVAGIADPSSIVNVDKRFIRPVDFVHLVGDPTKAGKILGWRPRTAFKDLVRTMVEEDLALVEKNSKNA